MATYAAVVSVVHLVGQIQAYYDRDLIFNDNQQRQVESLAEKVSFLQDFLESYSNDETESLESRILDVSYAVEDVIESYIVENIHFTNQRIKSNNSMCRPATIHFKKMEATRFSQDVRKLIESIDSIKREILKIKSTNKIGHGSHPNEPAGSFGVLPNYEKDTMVGFDHIFNSIIKKLTAKQSNLQVITISGMGGSGKSTLAKKVFDDRFLKQHFDICGWVTVSQEFDIEKVLSRLLTETGFPMHQMENQNVEYNKLGEKLHKHLVGRRYFLIIDDIWSLEAWDRIKLFLQDSNNGSRILVTTRLVNLANDISSFHSLKMELLDDIQSWDLLCKKVFGKERCPPQLEEVGKVVAKNCKGLPLSLVVIGGLLQRRVKREYWEYIAKDTNASVNLEDNERCLKILYMSYNHLPIHLKPCFLYLGVFPEDHEIRISDLIMLWVAERFLKPNTTKSLEEVAMDCVKDLIGRNLIFATEMGSSGNAKRCKVHDLLRDLCLREATKNKFLYASKDLEFETLQGFNSHRRRALFAKNQYGEYPPTFDLVTCSKSSSFLRSFICDLRLPIPTTYPLRLVSVLKLQNGYAKVQIPELLNSRYLNLSPDSDPSDQFPTISRLWNLQTLILRSDCMHSSFDFWSLPQIRHVIINKFYTYGAGQDSMVLENLRTLKGIQNFPCSENSLQKIPNVKTLSVLYDVTDFPSVYLQNVGRLTELESLKCFSYNTSITVSVSTLGFSLSLKKLSLKVNEWNWEDIGERVGLLPHLEIFKLCYFDGGEEWNSVEGRYTSLKYLFMCAPSLIRWTADSSCFPCLEHLRLSEMESMEEVPSEIGDIPTLRLIEVSCDSSISAIESAKMILSEQRSLGNEELLVTVDGRFYGAQSLSIFKSSVAN